MQDAIHQSDGLSLTVLPLVRLHPASAQREALVLGAGYMQDNKEEAEVVHSVEKGTCLSCQNT